MKTRDSMTYLEGMEAIPSGIMAQVLETAASRDIAACTEAQVRHALSARDKGVSDFAALLSPAAVPFLEEMAQAAQRETRRRFGNSVSVFTPVYLSNYCGNQCVYCGFNARSRIDRKRLAPSGIEEEFRAIAESGLQEILILTGESPSKSSVDYIGEACRMARRYFRSVGLEIYPVNSGDYARLNRCGADFVTVFQETYHPERYAELHPGGRKRIFPYRFHAQERALIGGFRGVGFAALLGLSDFRKDAFATGLHAFLIQRNYPHAEIAFSCPRLRPIQNASDQGAFAPLKIGEAELLQVICAYRLFMPFAHITISSRESARFRDNVVGIAATKISAGVDVSVGGHSGGAGEGQFEIDDGRSVDEIRRMLLSRKLQPVMSDYV